MKIYRKSTAAMEKPALWVALRGLVAMALMAPLVSFAGSVTDISLTKEASAETVVAGTQFDYTFTITNNGPQSTYAIFVDDPLAPELHFVNCSVPAGKTNNCEETMLGFRVELDGGLAVGSSYVVTLTVQLDESVTPGTQITNTATMSTSSEDTDPSNNSDSATITAESAAEPITYYLHGTDVPGTADGFTMDANPPSPPQPLQLNLANAPTWYSEPILEGTFAAGDFVLSFPCSLGLSLATTYALHRTAPDGSGPELISSLTQPLQICTGMQTITIPAGSAEEFDNERLRLRISTLLGLTITVDLGEDVKLVTPEFAEADDADPI